MKGGCGGMKRMGLGKEEGVKRRVEGLGGVEGIMEGGGLVWVEWGW